jgi:hypothetical protein
MRHRADRLHRACTATAVLEALAPTVLAVVHVVLVGEASGT